MCVAGHLYAGWHIREKQCQNAFLVTPKCCFIEVHAASCFFTLIIINQMFLRGIQRVEADIVV